MASPVKIELGAFAAGAVPPDIRHTYLDFLEVAVDITGFTTQAMNIEAIPSVTGPLGTGTINIIDALLGIVEYVWTLTDMAEPADYTAQLWVSNGTKKYESDLILYTVYDGPGSAP